MYIKADLENVTDLVPVEDYEWHFKVDSLIAGRPKLVLAHNMIYRLNVPAVTKLMSLGSLSTNK